MRFLVSVLLKVELVSFGSDLVSRSRQQGEWASRAVQIEVPDLETFELKLQQVLLAIERDFEKEFGCIAKPFSHSVTKL